jgi:hypothetical protein
MLPFWSRWNVTGYVNCISLLFLEDPPGVQSQLFAEPLYEIRADIPISVHRHWRLVALVARNQMTSATLTPGNLHPSTPQSPDQFLALHLFNPRTNSPRSVLGCMRGPRGTADRQFGRTVNSRSGTSPSGKFSRNRRRLRLHAALPGAWHEGPQRGGYAPHHDQERSAPGGFINSWRSPLESSHGSSRSWHRACQNGLPAASHHSDRGQKSSTTSECAVTRAMVSELCSFGAPIFR